MIRRVLRPLAVLSLVFGSLIGGFVPAAQAAGDLELSADGVHWGQNLPASVFDLSQKLVPGESHSAELWVRNGGQSAAELSAKVTAPSWQGLIADGTVQLRASTADGDRLLGSAGTVLFPLPAGQSNHFTLKIALTAGAGNQAELQSFPAGFELSLRQSAADPNANAEANANADANANANANAAAASNASANAAAASDASANAAAGSNAAAGGVDSRGLPGAEGPQLPTTGLPALGLPILVLAAILVAAGSGMQLLGRRNQPLERTE